MSNSKKRWLLTVALIALVAFAVGFAGYKTSMTGQAVYKRADAATFYVRSLNENGELKASGSGFCVSESGLALTASHVINGASAVHAVLNDGSEVTLSVLSCDTKTDVAVLRLPQRDAAYPFIELESENPESGESVYAIGYPLRTTKIISDGVVSNPDANINGTQRLLISAELASGMSGGPVVCEHGYAVGLNAATLRTMNGVSTSPTLAQLKEAVANAK